MGKRYILTGGDNGYCARCGGLCDRVVLEVDDDKKEITRVLAGAGVCLGKYCWSGYGEQHYPCRDCTLIRDSIWNSRTGTRFRNYRIRIGEEEFRLIVKHNKYGKDCEFGDKLDHYKWNLPKEEN